VDLGQPLYIAKAAKLDTWQWQTCCYVWTSRLPPRAHAISCKCRRNQLYRWTLEFRTCHWLTLVRRYGQTTQVTRALPATILVLSLYRWRRFQWFPGSRKRNMWSHGIKDTCARTSKWFGIWGNNAARYSATLSRERTWGKFNHSLWAAGGNVVDKRNIYAATERLRCS
jgi:hypothetical protein